MILQALTEYYRVLADRGVLDTPGWSSAKISFALCLSADGTLEQVISLQTQQPRGKKLVVAPQLVPSLPAPVKRSSGVSANFLWDNASYLLGMDSKGKPQRSLACFSAAKELHETLLQGVDSPAARALLAFFRTLDPTQGQHHPALQDQLEDILAGGNLLFRYEGRFVHQDPAIRQAWETHYHTAGEGPQGICLVTGEWGPIESIHPSIKHVAGAQSSGAALVSFNAPAFCSYGKVQNGNAPTSRFAAFAYTAALNHLLADRDHVYHVGDTSVVCWAKGGQPDYQILFGSALLGRPTPYSAGDLRGMVQALCAGQTVVFQAQQLDPNMEFYVLGLSPNAARLSVRFFLRNTFGDFLRHVQAHHRRLEIRRPSYDAWQGDLTPWHLLNETVNQNSRDRSPTPGLAGAVLRSVLTDTPYPATLLHGVTLRIRAEHSISWRRAAILKAYYLRCPHSDVPEEVLQVSLNPDATHVPYLLGRIFSLLETIQEAANPGINTTIKDRYFNSAAATPAIIFPTLIALAQKHLKKLTGDRPGLAISLNRQLTALLSLLPITTFPARMSLPEQGAFQLGYYHQTQARYQKKEEPEHV